MTASIPAKVDEDGRDSAVFGEVPEAKRRKFILVDDPDERKRVRVKVTLETQNLMEAPDDFRRRNCVYPRSFVPVGMPMEPRSTRGNRFFADDESEDGNADCEVTIGRTIVPVPMLEGENDEIPVPRISKARRDKEEVLNKLGYRMAWGQTKTFDRRTIFLQRAREYVKA